nr:hypothetical protein CFP56_01937 [Quercus suber]
MGQFWTKLGIDPLRLDFRRGNPTQPAEVSFGGLRPKANCQRSRIRLRWVGFQGDKIHRVQRRRFKKNKIQSLIREDPCQGDRLLAPR